jgi:hypothetical protein
MVIIKGYVVFDSTVEGIPVMVTVPSKPPGLVPSWQSAQWPSKGAPVLPVGGLDALANQTRTPSINPVNRSRRELYIRFIYRIDRIVMV